MLAWKAINKKNLLFNFIIVSITNLALYLLPLILSKNMVEPFSISNLTNIIIAVVVLKIIEISFNYIWQIYGEISMDRMYKDIEMSYFQQLITVKDSKINNAHSGFIKQTITKIADNMFDLITYVCFCLTGFIFGIGLFLYEVYNQNKAIFVISIISILFIIVVNFLLNKKHIGIQKELNNKMANFNMTTVDALENMKIIKLFNCMPFVTNKINNAYEDTVPPQKKAYKYRAIKKDGINAATYILLVIVLLDLYQKAKNGEFVFNYVVFYISIFGKISGELRGLNSLFLSITNLKASLKNWNEMIGNEHENIVKTNNWKYIKLSVKDFKYSDTNKLSINIPNFEIHKGDKVSIVGESGQGKSTFISLLLKHYDFDGNYLIDNKEADNLAPDAAIVSQMSDLFNWTIRENLTMGKDISDKTLYQYLDDAGLLSWALNLNDGLDTVVGERGLKLSVGQKQRLNLIRGLILDKDFYIFDEPTSNLDEESEIKIYDMINKYLADKTYIIITHRKKLVSLCTHHYVFENNILNLLPKTICK